ncbi:exopolysaccharide biosynthesis protein [Aurantiacibacter hainanensis]|uniref:exopolysaccharide biosynthesis protein n=1 Tax=Aurantiacibacter hainanensis TaxID=3076114 RepID=UPI0030C66C37
MSSVEVHSVCDILDRLREVADSEDKVSVGDVLDAIGDRSYGPTLLIPALVEITPIGGIPGVPTFLALIIALTAVQMLFDKDHLWLPGFIQNRTVSASKLHKAADKLNGTARRLDKWFHGRMPRFVKQPWPRVAAVAIIILCCTVPPLEFLPFASTAPMLAIAAFGLALLVRDGLLMLIALGLSAASLALGAGLVGSSGFCGSGGEGEG